MTHPKNLWLSFSFALVASLLGCGGSGGSGAVASQPTFAPGVAHPFFPVVPRVIHIYEGDYNGRDRREVVRTVEQSRVIEDVMCAAVLQDVFVDGELFEITTEWYAQDQVGNVWKFGEETFEVVGGVPVLQEDSWIAGEGAGERWIAFPAKLAVGDVFYGYTPTGLDEFHVRSLSAVASVRAGTFSDCLEILENPDDPEDADIILYGGGVGRLSEVNVVTGLTDLVSIRGE